MIFNTFVTPLKKDIQTNIPVSDPDDIGIWKPRPFLKEKKRKKLKSDHPLKSYA